MLTPEEKKVRQREASLRFRIKQSLRVVNTRIKLYGLRVIQPAISPTKVIR